MPNADQERNSGSDVVTEWQAARGVLARFDENLHDLRKYGFSFVTGLLTVDALFANISDNWKLAALIGTMALIVVLSVVDRNYQVFLKGANHRATLLENRCTFELTKIIGRIYEQEHAGTVFTVVYCGLVGVTFVLGLLILKSNLLHLVSHLVAVSYLYALLIALLIAVFLILSIRRSLDLRPWVYFEIDRFEYKKGERVLVVVTNVAKDELKLSLDDLENKIIWSVYSEHDATMDRPIHEEALNKDIVLGKNSDHLWQFPTGPSIKYNLFPGLYRIVYKGPIYVERSRKDKLERFWKNGFCLKKWSDDRVHDRQRRWTNAARFRLVD